MAMHAITRSALLSFVLGAGLLNVRAQPSATVAAGQPPETEFTQSMSIPASVKVLRNIRYCSGGGHSLFLDMYLPRNVISNSLPAVLWLHGGGWRTGNRSNNRLAVELAARGFIAASADYRLSGEAPFPAAIEDAKCAVRYLRANAHNYGISPDRIGVAGSSAGGHLAMMIGTAPIEAGLEGTGGWESVSSAVQAVLSWFGPTDFSMTPQEFEDGKAPSVLAFLGGTPAQQPCNYRNASPVTWVSKGDPPLLIFHGDKDTTVSYDQSERIAAAYRKAGLEVELVTVINAGHGFKQVGNQSISPSFSEILEKSIAFFQIHLTGQTFVPAKP